MEPRTGLRSVDPGQGAVETRLLDLPHLRRREPAVAAPLTRRRSRTGRLRSHEAATPRGVHPKTTSPLVLHAKPAERDRVVERSSAWTSLPGWISASASPATFSPSRSFGLAPPGGDRSR